MNFIKLTFLVIFLAGILSSCSKPEPTTPYWGEATAQLNGKSKEFYPRAEMSEDDENFTLDLRAYADEWLLKEHFFVQNIPFKEGTYHFKPALQSGDYGQLNPKLLMLQENSDSVYNTYELSEQSPMGFITIDKIKNDIIWGTFRTKLYRDSSSDTSTPEIYNFTTGSFKTKIL